MAAGRSVQGLKRVKPILSLNKQEARIRVLNLYRAWYRAIPKMCQEFDLEVSVDECRATMRKAFESHKDEKDIRVIDMLCIKAVQELDEIRYVWKQDNHVMSYFKHTWNAKPDGFLGRFYDGHDPEPPKLN